MFAQLKYSSRIVLGQRLLALGINIAFNLVFFLLGRAGLLPEAWLVTGLVFSSLGLCALFVVNIIADFESIRSLFAAPSGYTMLLTPVPGWKIILSRVAVMTVLDIVSYTVGVLGLLLQSRLGDGWRWEYGSASFEGEHLTTVITGLIGYFMFLTLIVFACALAKSVLFPLRGRGILACAAAIALTYLASWLNLLLTPFAEVSRYGMFFTVSLVAGWNPGMIAYIVLTLIETIALLTAASYLYERKVNI